MTDDIHTLVGIPPKELDMLKRKAAAFDAMVEHQFSLSMISNRWAVWDRDDNYLHTVGRHLTPLEAVEAAVKKLGET